MLSGLLVVRRVQCTVDILIPFSELFRTGNWIILLSFLGWSHSTWCITIFIRQRWSIRSITVLSWRGSFKIRISFRWWVHSLSILIHFNTFFFIVLSKIETVFNASSKSLVFHTLFSDFFEFSSEKLLDVCENFRARVKILVEKVQPFFMKILENIVYLCCWSESPVLNPFSLRFKITLLSTIKTLESSSKLT